ncbi:hypothetical protein [Dysgonomonas sp. 520]|uniref:hypothetical protein n=1 Tax=Dysgonomonas sp. 520 TaxID=2302931 RepID=UPI0013D4DC47|nr:hypothetical protein [Dysgonomonas sp. 520]NDW10337.1 hypothetical protein [Dysgonomonas sp. 520]
MIVQSYYIALIALIVATAILGLLFIAQHSQNETTMRNFHIAKRLMAAAYFCVAVGKLLELLSHIGGQTAAAETPKILLSQVITLVVAVSQALIFTLSCLLLLDTKSVNREQLKVQIIHSCLIHNSCGGLLCYFTKIGS